VLRITLAAAAVLPRARTAEKSAEDPWPLKISITQIVPGHGSLRSEKLRHSGMLIDLYHMDLQIPLRELIRAATNSTFVRPIPVHAWLRRPPPD